MIKPEDRIEITRKGALVYSIIVFFCYIFAFLAAATEVRDVLDVYLTVTISPRLALVIISLLQTIIWFSWAYYTTMKDESIIFIIFMTLVMLVSYLFSETRYGEFLPGNFFPLFHTIFTLFIGIIILVSAWYASMKVYYKALLTKHV
jgi:hypothetical protein